MIKIILFIGLYSIGILTYGQSIPPDKQKHFAAGVIVGGMTSIHSKRPFLTSVATSVFIGLGKETYDLISGQGVAEIKDAGYTAVGGICIGTVIYVGRRYHKKRKYRR